MNFSTQSRNNINKDIVKQAAEYLILTNGQTTTLEVKTHLRNQNYIAFQSEVSKIMEEIGLEQDWDVEFNGTYRVFRLMPVFDFASAWGLPKFSDN